ncbi:AICAR transformylase [Klebsormidium nitens]|uniref:AICAR transformylase n=1 Tax=Klebsormidium nitens TaxID=105231 RepID=A0A1Y1HMI9_KLENI|nr:AICAR transformylase [Klebsormidium nitens]|eukprot:GAQ79835.1 AICAR transformylase [Klebsormidium nitens]
MASSLGLVARAPSAGAFIAHTPQKEASFPRADLAPLAFSHQRSGTTTSPSESCVRPVGGSRLGSAFLGDLQQLQERPQPLVRAMASGAAAAAPAMASLGDQKQALLTVSDKTGLIDLAKGLIELGYALVSTGGTAAAIEKAGVPVKKVEEVTSFPEMLDGRVKTLHPAVHGGILARRDVPGHVEALEKHKIGTIDIVVCNLYPFYQTVMAPGGTSFENGVENIDIGGPAMIRAAAKNHGDVFVVVEPPDYSTLLDVLKKGAGGDEELAFKKKLAWKAYQHTSSYDSAVAEWLWKNVGGSEPAPSLTVPLTLASSLRYGENPHQSAAFYTDRSLQEHGAGGIATAVQHHGKEMSYNNYLDADAAWNCVNEFPDPTAVVVKHTNPCGVASSKDDLLEAYRLAVRADPVSAFGGIVAFNVPVDETLAREIREFRSPTDGETRMFYEIVVAPEYTEAGLATLKGKSKTLRILEAKARAKGKQGLRQVGGGWLLQDADDKTPEDIEFKVVSQRQPTKQELADVKFAWRVCKHVKSNAITVAKGNRLLGMGSGQPNRVKSLQIAVEKAGDEVQGSALASDAFFPFAWGDAVEDACKAGVAIIAQPGGSLRDQDAIDCCNKYNVALVMTGVRHFRH